MNPEGKTDEDKLSADRNLLSYFKLVWMSLLHYRKSHLTVLAGVIVATAVLTGALMVGDSVRGSLKRITGQRLGSIRYAIMPGEHLFSVELARELRERGAIKASPILITGGIAIFIEGDRRINRATIIGIDETFPEFWIRKVPFPRSDEAVMNIHAAAKLGVKAGDRILIRLDPVEKTSRNAPFIPDRRDPVSLRLTVSAIADETSFGRFSLKNEQSTPLNVFINLDQLAHRMKIDGYVNGLVIGGTERSTDQERADSVIQQIWQPEDAGLHIRKLEPEKDRPGVLRKVDSTHEYEITTDQIFLSVQQEKAIGRVIPQAKPFITYLINSISKGTRATPYSFVTAVDTGFLNPSPGKGEIVIGRWLAEDLKSATGDTLSLAYQVMGPARTLKERREKFIVKAVVNPDQILFGPQLMPRFPGIAETVSCRDWETGSPVDLSRIRDKDEDYWKQYRGTPKAFIFLEGGRNLWTNAFGSLTAFRFTASDYQVREISQKLMQTLRPRENGLAIRPVYQEGMVAAAHSTDFGGLFLGLGFFIIVAAFLLTGLLFSMQISDRMAEAGLMLAVGFRRRTVTCILVGESFVVAFTGGIAGALAGILCNHLLVTGLNTLWTDAVNTSSLVASVRLTTLLTGAFSGMAMATAVMWMTLRRRRRLPESWLLKGVRKIPLKTGLRRSGNLITAVILGIGTFAILVTGANRKNLLFETDRDSGTGGFMLWTETTLPVFQNLNDRNETNRLYSIDEAIPEGVTFIPLQVKAGDDASCLNLNQIARPPLMAVPSSLFDSLGVFSFSSLDSAADPDHPWKFLDQSSDTGVINAYADMTVITWGLQKKIGDTIIYMDETGREIPVRLAGGLDNSIFQGNLLISDRKFRKHFPSVAGARIILVDGPGEEAEKVAGLLEKSFRDDGMMVTTAVRRLDSFNMVENTYLNMFMLLGALGMIIGTAGLGIILKRNIQERRGELALMRAIGYKKRQILTIFFKEYTQVLLAGTALGIIPSALIMLTAILKPGNHLPLMWMAVIVALILISGMIWIWIPLRRTLNRELIKGMKEE